MKWTAAVPLGLALLAAGYGLGRSGAPGERRAEQSKSLPTPIELHESSQENREFISALQSALAEPMLLERTLRSAQALSQLSATNVEDTLALYDQEEDATQPIKGLLVSAWIRFDPQGAFDYLRGAGGFVEQQLLPGLLEGWATLDPQAARRAHATIPPASGPSFGPASRAVDAPLAGLIRGWARSGEPGVLQFLSEQGEGSKQLKWLSFCLDRRIGRDGAIGLRDWVDDLSDDEFPARFQQLLLERVAATLAKADPQLAATWATKHAEGEAARGVVRGVAKAWVTHDGPATMRWLAGLPANEAVSAAVDTAFSLWLARGQEAAMAWAEGTAGELAWEPAIALYAAAVAKDDPLAGLELAEQLSDPALRSRSIIGIGKRWYAEAPGPATSWLEDSDLTEEQRELVTAQRGKRVTRKTGKKPKGVDPRRK